MHGLKKIVDGEGPWSHCGLSLMMNLLSVPLRTHRTGKAWIEPMIRGFVWCFLVERRLTDKEPTTRQRADASSGEASVMWLYSPGHTETRNSRSLRGVF